MPSVVVAVGSYPAGTAVPNLYVAWPRSRSVNVPPLSVPACVAVAPVIGLVCLRVVYAV